MDGPLPTWVCYRVHQSVSLGEGCRPYTPLITKILEPPFGGLAKLKHLEYGSYAFWASSGAAGR